MKSRIKTKSRIRIKYFPFSPGIPWKVKNGKYILPEIDSEILLPMLDGVDVAVTCFGGPFESFFSLSYFEVLKSIVPSEKLFWVGDKKYFSWVRAQGLARPSRIKIDKSQLESYPVPLFLDREKNIYFNVLNNYRELKSYWGRNVKVRKETLAEQLFSNSLSPWNGQHVQLRNVDSVDRHRYILVIIDGNGKCLDWNFRHVRELASILRQIGITVYCLSDDERAFIDGSVVRPIAFEELLKFIPDAFMILSSRVDWLLIGLMLSRSAVVVSQDFDCRQEDLFENAEFLGVDNVISIHSRWISPMEVFDMCKGILS